MRKNKFRENVEYFTNPVTRNTFPVSKVKLGRKENWLTVTFPDTKQTYRVVNL